MGKGGSGIGGQDWLENWRTEPRQPQRFRGGARSVTDRVVPVFGGGVWFVCSRRVAVAPGVPGAGTGSDCAGGVAFPVAGTGGLVRRGAAGRAGGARRGG